MKNHLLCPGSSTRIAMLCASIASALMLATIAEAQPGGTTPPAVEIAGTQTLKYTSASMNQEFNLLVNLPRDYADTTKTFPVVFVLDGQWDFPLVSALYGQQYFDGFMPSAIVVGIAWGGRNPDYDALRARDLTPTTAMQNPNSGNGPHFLQCIKQELIPFIESRYRVRKDNRTLMGSSLGGLFTLYTLFTETPTFSRYVLTSPAIGANSNTIQAFARNYVPPAQGRKVKLFMAQGGLEGGVKAFTAFADWLKEKNLSGLEMETRILEGMGHSGGKAEGYTRGLQYVFARPNVSLDAAILKRYEGAYQINPQVTLSIQREDDHLLLVQPDGQRILLFPEDTEHFYVKGAFALFHFKTDREGTITGFDVEQYAGGFSATKVR